LTFFLSRFFYNSFHIPNECHSHFKSDGRTASATATVNAAATATVVASATATAKQPFWDGAAIDAVDPHEIPAK
jgi:hypothetical protein